MDVMLYATPLLVSILKMPLAVSVTPRKIGDQGALGTGLFKSYEVVFNYPNRTSGL